MTVSELIVFLQQQPQDLLVVYCLHSEQCLLEQSDISIEEFCEPRPDGWIQNKRPDLSSRPYVLFPGN